MDKNKFNLTFDQVDHSDALEEQVNKKNKMIEDKYGDRITRMEWVISKENPKESPGKTLFRSAVRIHLKQRKEIFASTVKKNVHGSITDCYRKIIHQLE